MANVVRIAVVRIASLLMGLSRNPLQSTKGRIRSGSRRLSHKIIFSGAAGHPCRQDSQRRAARFCSAEIWLRVARVRRSLSGQSCLPKSHAYRGQRSPGQWTPLPECPDDFIDESNPVRVIDVFVDALDLAEMNFEGAGGDWSASRKLALVCPFPVRYFTARKRP